MNRKKPTDAPGRDRMVPLLRAALIAAGLVSHAALGQGQIQSAGDLFVDIDATELPEGPLATIDNEGTLGGLFEARGGADMTPVVTTVGGTKGIQFDGNDFYQLVEDVGGQNVLPPAGLVGEDPTRSIEVWALNPDAAGEETLVSWGRRGGPDGTNMSFGYGSDFRWGAVGHWGGDGPDLGWSNDGGNPEVNKWHHLVYTFDGATSTTRVYVDGVIANGEILAAGLINTYADTSINIATQLEPDGTTPTAGLRLTGTIARVRIHDGVLTPEQVAGNYALEKPAFIDPEPEPPPPPTAQERLVDGPIHRYSFGETAATEIEGMEFRDSVGTAHGTVYGAGASFSGSRLVLPGGPSTDAAFGDLPNGMISQNSTNNGGSGEFAIETWVKITGSRTWSRIFDIGSTITEDGSGEVVGPGFGGEGRDYLEYSAQIGDDVNNRRLEVRNEDPGGGGIVTGDVPTQTFNTDVHVVATWDEATGSVELYENGVRIGGVVTDDAMSEINDVNVWLGRSNWVADQNTQGEYDEVRIYDSVLTPGEVLGNYLAGPDLINDHDAPVVIVGQPQDASSVPEGSATFRVVVNGSTPIAFRWLRNGEAIPGATNSTYTLTGISAADNDASFTVEVSNTVDGAPVTVTSNPARLTVASDTVTLKHRYSFNETTGTQVTDSVGGANGEAIGGVTFAEGMLELDGADGSYVNLPNGIITALGNNATIEMWVTYAGGPNWTRVFDFGTSTGGEDISDGGADVDYLFFTAKTAQGFPRFEANFPGGGVTTVVNHPGAMPVNEEEHLVITYSFTGNVSRMYTNGTMVATAPDTVPQPLSALDNRDVNNWLGRSQFPDPYWAGKYNEFRIYQGAMTPEQVAASFAAGPNATPAERPTLSVARDGTNIRITFTGVLEGADAVTGPWAPVAGATSPATISAATGQRFFRAAQ
jgi:hypothetical protein